MSWPVLKSDLTATAGCLLVTVRAEAAMVIV
jgi:hypothetical protein